MEFVHINPFLQEISKKGRFSAEFFSQNNTTDLEALASTDSRDHHLRLSGADPEGLFPRCLVFECGKFVPE